MAGQAALPAETAGDAVTRLTRVFAAAGLETPRLDARLLVAAALGVDQAALRRDPDQLLASDAAVRLDTLAHRRARDREPVSRLLGRREFWSLDFRIGPATLDPRPDSEAVVAAALDVLPADRPARILDLGTGSGCLLLAILHERPGATGVGTDIDPAAAAAARRNAGRLGLAGRAQFVCTRWAAGLAVRFDLVVSNPPYIPAADIGGLAPEVARHDPLAALDGGPDGLDAYREIARQIPGLLAAGGQAAVEIGADQAGAVTKIFRPAGLVRQGVRTDLGGMARCLIFRAN